VRWARSGNDLQVDPIDIVLYFIWGHLFALARAKRRPHAGEKMTRRAPRDRESARSRESAVSLSGRAREEQLPRYRGDVWEV
jgi:hypothetical protein